MQISYTGFDEVRVGAAVSMSKEWAFSRTSFFFPACHPPLSAVRYLLIILTMLWGMRPVKCRAGRSICYKLQIVVCIFLAAVVLCFIPSCWVAGAGSGSPVSDAKLHSLIRSRLATFLQWFIGRAKPDSLRRAWVFCIVEGASQYFLDFFQSKKSSAVDPGLENLCMCVFVFLKICFVYAYLHLSLLKLALFEINSDIWLAHNFLK